MKKALLSFRLNGKTNLLKVYLPNVENEFNGYYWELLKSTLEQLKRFSLLREASLIGGLLFGVFCSTELQISCQTFNLHTNFR